MLKRPWAFILAFIMLAVFTSFAQEKGGSRETESAVPELEAFHEIIYPIWHTAYPAKDIAALKSFVPQVNELAAKVYAATLPGILREKEGKWKAGVSEFKKAVDAYNAAAAGSDGQALLNAAEALHMRYEMLVRAIRPVLAEMDAFHKVLYVIYHRAVPEKQWDEVRKAAPDLRAKAEAITKAQLPKRQEAKAVMFKAAAEELLKAATELEGLGKDADGPALEKAVDKVHAKYVALQSIFD